MGICEMQIRGNDAVFATRACELDGIGELEAGREEERRSGCGVLDVADGGPVGYKVAWGMSVPCVVCVREKI